MKIISLSQRLRLKREDLAARVTLTFVGAADLTCVNDLQVELNEVAALQPTEVILDFSELEVITSLAMGTLVTFAKSIKQNQGSVKIVKAPPQIAEILGISGLGAIFDGLSPSE